ncbi:MAG: phosphatase PAP2 family protein [Polaromonas sp.]
MPHAAPLSPLSSARLGSPSVWLTCLVGFVWLLVWDYSRFDVWMASGFGDISGFALQNHWFWKGVLHDDIRPLPWALELALVAGIAWPLGSLRQLPMARRVQVALTTVLALLLVSGMKLHSSTSCPWDLRQFGGVAVYVSHWARGVADGGGGGCFPAGHASAGFAFLGGFFAFRHTLPGVARRWLVGALAAGLVMGMAQQVRGAHYMSHTLWTAWLCWSCAALVDAAVSAWMLRRDRRTAAAVSGG